MLIGVKVLGKVRTPAKSNHDESALKIVYLVEVSTDSRCISLCEWYFLALCAVVDSLIMSLGLHSNDAHVYRGELMGLSRLYSGL